MIIEQNGVRVGLEIDGSNLKFKVLAQDAETTKILRSLGNVVDEETGFSMRTNKFPSFNHQKKRFYLRGIVADKNDREVTAKLDSPAQARAAAVAIRVLLSKIRPPLGVPQEAGSTAACRIALIPREMATMLRLTHHKNWPGETGWTPARAFQIGNPHFDEHLAQIVDVLNKAHGADIRMDHLHEQVANNVHLEKVSAEDAAWACGKIRELNNEACERGVGAATALWRIYTGLRAPDVTGNQLAALIEAGIQYDSDRPNVNDEDDDADIEEDNG
jgi:hypothetical protein